MSRCSANTSSDPSRSDHGSLAGSCAIAVTIDQACDLLYRGKANVWEAAEACGLPPDRMKLALAHFIFYEPFDPNGWEDNEELSWPWS